VGPPQPQPITDPSITDTSTPYDRVVPVHLVHFANELDQFPAVEDGVGAIIRLHRVGMQSYQGLPQLVGRQFKSSFVVFKRKVDEASGLPVPPVLPHRMRGGQQQDPDVSRQPLGETSEFFDISASSPNYSFRGESELCALLDLHDWGVGLLRRISYTTPLPVLPVETSGEPSRQPQVRDYHLSFRKQHQQIIDAGPGFGGFTGIDCVGMVLGVLDAASEMMPCRVFLWDGTCDGVVRPAPAGGGSSHLKAMGTELQGEAFVAAMASIRRSLAYAGTPTPSATSTAQSNCDILSSLFQHAGADVSSSVCTASSTLLGGRGVLCFNPDAVSQRIVAQRLRPGMWVRVRMLASSKLAHLSAESARVLTGSAINVLPPYHT
jgi:hypothetical protein